MTIVSPQEQTVRDAMTRLATARIAAREVAAKKTARSTLVMWFWKALGFVSVYAALFAGGALAFIPLMAWRAFAVSELWAWFVTPHWPNFLPNPSIYVTGGLLIVLSAIMPHGASPKKTAKHQWAAPFVLPAMFLAAGWVWKWWFT